MPVILNAMECRFLNIKRFSQEEVIELHRRESAADDRWRKHRDGTPEQRGDGWTSAGSRYVRLVNAGKPAFWDPRMPEQERNRLLDAFLLHPAVRRAFKLLENVERSEVDCQHSADWHVWKEAPEVGVTVAAAHHAASAPKFGSGG